MNDQVDISLIAACQQGDPRAFRQVFETYRDRIYAFCRHMSGDPDQADDLAQDVFVSAFQNIGSFRGEAAFGTWLYRIAVNRCAAESRKRSQSFQSFEALEEIDAAPPSHDPSPEDLVVRKELSGRVQAAVTGLPSNLRLLFVLGTLVSRPGNRFT